MKRAIVVTLVVIIAGMAVFYYGEFRGGLYTDSNQTDEYLSCMRGCLNDPNFPDSLQPPDDGTVSGNPAVFECQYQCEEYRRVVE